MSRLDQLPKLPTPPIPAGFGLDGVIIAVCAADRDRQRLMELARVEGFKGSDQPRINCMCWRALQDGTPRIGGSGFQVVPARGALLEPLESLPNNFSQPVVFHWMGKKPKLGRKAWLVEHFRREYLRKAGRAQGATLRLFLEEAGVILQQHKRSLQKRFSNKNSSPLP